MVREVESQPEGATKIGSSKSNMEGLGIDQADESDDGDESYMSFNQQNVVYLDLRVYTEKAAGAALVYRQSRHETFEGLATR